MAAYGARQPTCTAPIAFCAGAAVVQASTGRSGARLKKQDTQDTMRVNAAAVFALLAIAQASLLIHASGAGRQDDSCRWTARAGSRPREPSVMSGLNQQHDCSIFLMGGNEEQRSPGLGIPTAAAASAVAPYLPTFSHAHPPLLH